MQPLLFAAIAALALAGPALGAVVLGPPPPPEAPALPLPLDEAGAVRMHLTEAPPLTMDVASMPSLSVGSLPALDVASLPLVQVGSLPAVEVASMPALTIASMPPQTFQAEFPGAMDVTLTNGVLQVNGTLQLLPPPEPVRVVVAQGRQVHNVSQVTPPNPFTPIGANLVGLGVDVTGVAYDECHVRAVVFPQAGLSLFVNRSLLYSIPGSLPVFQQEALASFAITSAPGQVFTRDFVVTPGTFADPEEDADGVTIRVNNPTSIFTRIEFRTICYRFDPA